MNGNSIFAAKQEGLLEEDVLLKYDEPYSVSLFSSALLIANSVIGISPVTIGYIFHEGIILTTIIHAFAALITYIGCWILCKLTQMFKTFSYEKTWKASLHRYQWITSVVVIIVGCAFSAWAFISIVTLVRSFIDDIFPEAFDWVRDPYFIMILAATIFVFPTCFRASMNIMLKISYLGMTCILYDFFLILYYFIDSLIKRGFNPDHEVTWVNPEGGDPIACFSKFIGAYTGYIFNFPAMRHMRNYTFKRVKKMSITMVVMLFIIFETMGLISYFTIWNTFDGQSIFKVIEHKSIFKSLGYLAMAIKIAASISQYVYSIKESFMSLVIEEKKEYTIIDSMCSITFLVVSIFYAQLGLKTEKVVALAMNAGVQVIGFIIPSVMMIAGRRFISLWQSVLMVIICLLGLAFLVISAM